MHVEPGVYDLGARALEMKPYVDLEGSGEGMTTVTSSVETGYGTVVGSDNAELRFLTIQNSGGGTLAIALSGDSVSPRLTRVTLTATGATVNFAFRFSNGLPALSQVTASASGGSEAVALVNLGGSVSASNSAFRASNSAGLNAGVLSNYGGATRFSDSTLSASGGPVAIGFRAFDGTHAFTNATIGASAATTSYGIYNGHKTSQSVVTINQSRIAGGTRALLAESGPVRIGASQLGGGVQLGAAGTVTCAASYDGSFQELSPACS